MVKVTVLIAAYNEAENIEKCLSSIINQSFNNYKVLLLDDGSTDETASIAEGFLSNTKIDYRVIKSLENVGKISVINRNISYLNSEYVAIHDADDEMYPDRLKDQVKYLDDNPTCDILGGQQCLIFDNGIKKILKPPTEHAQICTRLLTKTTMLNPTVMFRKTRCLVGGNFLNEEAYLSEDFHFFVTCFTRGLRFHNLSKVVCTYHFNEQKNWQLKHPKMIHSLKNIFRIYLSYRKILFKEVDIETLLLINIDKKLSFGGYLRFIFLQLRIFIKNLNHTDFSITSWLFQNFYALKLVFKKNL